MPRSQVNLALLAYFAWMPAFEVFWKAAWGDMDTHKMIQWMHHIPKFLWVNPLGLSRLHNVCIRWSRQCARTNTLCPTKATGVSTSTCSPCMDIVLGSAIRGHLRSFNPSEMCWQCGWQIWCIIPREILNLIYFSSQLIGLNLLQSLHTSHTEIRNSR